MKTEEEMMKKYVLRAHNIETTKEGLFMCNDGDMFANVWEALEHTIWLEDGKERECDLMSKTINDNDYYEIIKERPSYQSKKEKEYEVD